MKNRIAMAGHISRCWLFVYRVPIAQLQPLLPAPLKLVTCGPFAFLNIVVSDLKQMRPTLLPLSVGIAYRHVAYRLHVEYGDQGGLFFLRSDADSGLVCAAGNVVTDFKFHRAAVEIGEDRVSVRAAGADADVVFGTGEQTELVPGSPFKSLAEAAAFLKYKPAALTVRNDAVRRLPIKREESAWKSRLVEVKSARFDFLRGFDATFELCYSMEPIDYVWQAEEVLR